MQSFSMDFTMPILYRSNSEDASCYCKLSICHRSMWCCVLSKAKLCCSSWVSSQWSGRSFIESVLGMWETCHWNEKYSSIVWDPKEAETAVPFCPEPVLPALPVRANHLEEYYFSVDPVKIVLNNLFPSFGPPLPTNCTCTRFMVIPKKNKG